MRPVQNSQEMAGVRWDATVQIYLNNADWYDDINLSLPQLTKDYYIAIVRKTHRLFQPGDVVILNVRRRLKMTIPDDSSLRCPKLEANELKRLADVVDMKRTRFPRAGDRCLFLIDMNAQPYTPVFDTVHLSFLSANKTRITFANNAGSAYVCDVDDYHRKWWFADDTPSALDPSALDPSESCYEASVLRGVARADKLKTVWDALRAELETASASLSKIVGRSVKLKIVAIPGSNAPFTAFDVRAFCKSSYEPGQICAEIRLLCPSLQYESSPLAYVLSHFEGLPFLFAYKNVDSSAFVYDMVADEDRLPVHLQFVLKKMLSGTETGHVVRTLMDRTKSPVDEPKAQKSSPRSPFDANVVIGQERVAEPSEANIVLGQERVAEQSSPDDEAGPLP